MKDSVEEYGRVPLITAAFRDSVHTAENPNERLFRSDLFKTDHSNGKHILFAGCSFTWGEGLEKEESWAHRVYEKFQARYEMDGFFNLGRPGFSSGESINHIFLYLRNYGNPEAIFLFLPDHGRDMKYVSNDNGEEALNSYVYTMYLYLDTYCKSHGIKLITSTWAEDINGFGDHLLPGRGKKIFYPGTTLERPHWSQQLGNSPSKVLGGFDSYHQVDKPTLTKRVFEIDVAKRGDAKKYSLIAADAGAHPGTSFHDYWAEFMFDIWDKSNSDPAS